MLKAVSFLLALFISFLNFGCGSAAQGNSAASNNANRAANTASVNVSSTIPPSNETSANAPGAQNRGVSNTAANNGPVVRTIKPGEKIPGIPDAATIKKQMATPVDPSKLPPEFRRALNAGNANVARPMKKKP